MTVPPQISVIVPVYNSADTIEACADSILTQTGVSLQLILVNDGSTDGTADICDALARRDTRVTLVHQPNKGRAEARHVGVEQATGQWVGFVDSDDTLPPGALQHLLAGTAEDTDIVFGNGYSLHAEQRSSIPIDEFRHLTVRAEGMIGVPWGSLYRRKVLTPWLFDLPRHIMMGEDYLFWLRLVFATEKPVNVVYEKVYEKGDDHTSNSFKWTAGYCQELNELRRASIPEAVRSEFEQDMIDDRLANMFSIAQWNPRSEWAGSRYYRELLSDMATHGRRLSLKNRLFLSLPALWLRRLYAWTSLNLCYAMFLTVVGIAMLLLNLLDAPTLSDDMIYRFKWNADESAAVECIENLGDLFSSQLTHYLTTNGRLSVNLLAQTFLVFVPPVVTQVLNSVLFVVLLHFCCCLTAKPGRRLFVAMMACTLLFVVFQGFRTTMVWSLGAFNYLWVLVATLGFLLFMQSLHTHQASPTPHSSRLAYHLSLLSPLAVFAGWTHEGLALPLSVAFAAWLMLGGRKRWHSAATPFLLFYMVGCCLCLLSPGLWSRSADAVSLQSRLLSGAMNCVFNIRVTWLLLITLCMKYKISGVVKAVSTALSTVRTVRTASPRRSDCESEPFGLRVRTVRTVTYAYLALATSIGIVLLCGTNLERVAFFTDFIAMLLLLHLLQELLSATWHKRLMEACVVLLLLSFVPAWMVRKENHDSWLMAERQMEMPGRELIAVTMPVRGQNVLTDYFRDHYVNPSFDFGFYCSYMGFDAKDINMRCAARLYDKQKLYFLPEDVVRRAEADSTAYTNYELDEHGALFVWRMADDAEVDSLVFILNDEDPATLGPVQRLVAYPDSTFLLDDYHHETVSIGARHYLVFTRPTTNIYRRIKNIKYTVRQ